MSLLVSFLIVLQSLCANLYAQVDDELDKLLMEDQAIPPAQSQNPSTTATSSELQSIISESGVLNNPPVEDNDFLKSGENLYSPPVVLRRKNIVRDYSHLEKETPVSKFDKDGFYKSRYSEIKKITEAENKKDSYYGGYVCLGDNAGLLGKISNSGKNSSPLHEGDEMEIEFSVYRNCVAGEKYVSMDKDVLGVYKITGVLEIVDKAVKERNCVAKVKDTYDAVRRGAYVSLPIQFESSHFISEEPAQIAKIYKLHSDRVIAGTGDRLCILFKDQLAPRAGTIVYFYDTKDPVTGQTVNPYMVAKGKLIYSYSSYGTTLITSSNRPVTKDMAVTTRF